jgi:hypothetical protein
MSRLWFGEISEEQQRIELMFNLLMERNPDPNHRCLEDFWSDPQKMIDAWHETTASLLRAAPHSDEFQKLLWFRWDLNCRLDEYAEAIEDGRPVTEKQNWERVGILKARASETGGK